MIRSIKFFISSSPELAPEREALGQAVAELPISTGWEIKHTPRGNEDAWEALDFIEQCDLCVTVLGSDFAAPMGLEWERAFRTSRPMLAYRKRGLYSPSAQRLLRQSKTTWEDFRSPQELKGSLKRTLAKFLLDHGERFGLRLPDVEGLLAETQKPQQESAADEDPRQGAGRSGVILSRNL
jgi:hypothetical protein